MVTKEQIKKEVDNLPENLLNEVHDFLISISEKTNTEESEEEKRKSGMRGGKIWKIFHQTS